MEKIILEVDENTAKNWENVPAGIKKQVEESFEKQIAILSQSMNVAEFKALRSELSSEAQKNGLTEDILDILLNEE